MYFQKKKPPNTYAPGNEMQFFTSLQNYMLYKISSIGRN